VYEAPERDGKESATDNGISGIGSNLTDNGFPGVGQKPSSEVISAGHADNWKPEAGQPVTKDQGLRDKDNNQEPSPPPAANTAPDPVVEILDAEIIEDGEAEQDPGSASPGPEPENAGTVLAAYIDWRQEQGIAGIDKRTKGLLARQLKEAFDAGHSAEVIKRGLWCWHQSNQHASTLFSFIEAEARSGGRPLRVTEHERRLAASVQELLDMEAAS
jgi:hypothetical protein